MLRFHLKLIVAFFATTVLAAVSLPSHSADHSASAPAKFITATLCAIQREDFAIESSETLTANEPGLLFSPAFVGDPTCVSVIAPINSIPQPYPEDALTGCAMLARPPPSGNFSPVCPLFQKLKLKS